MKALLAGFLTILAVAGAPAKMEKIRTSRHYIVTGPHPSGVIMCDEVPHDGDNVKYFTREDLVKMLALFPVQPAVP